MDRHVKAVIQASLGRKGTREFPVTQVQAYQIEAAMDTDADAFSIDLGDPHGTMTYLTERDTEVKVSLFLSDERNKLLPIFTGFADTVSLSSDDHTLSIIGRDMSCLATDTDAPPGKWKHVRPKQFISERARSVGLTNIVIHAMSEIGTLYSDGSETEWAMWYRIAREKKMWLWTGPQGYLYCDKLNYALTPKYKIGFPPKGSNSVGWLTPKVVQLVSGKQGRIRQAWVYGEDGKKGIPFLARGVDTTLKSWKRKPLKIITSTTVNSTAAAKKLADEEVFESIVGANEIQVILHDTGQIIEQNQIAHLNIPDQGLAGNYFVVGVTRSGGPDGFQQTVRLRERGFALSKRVPAAPKLVKDDDPTKNAIPTTLTNSLDVKWADSFVRGTREFGVAAGWDFAVFLGVVLAICQHESRFRNIRNIVAGFPNEVEWQPYAQFARDTAPHGTVELYHRTFANMRTNPLNPRGSSSDTAVGPMQLISAKDWADEYGFNGKAVHDEYQGGRWNPDSNIRAACRLLVEKLNTAPKADPNTPSNIWIGVARYYGSRSASANQAYVTAVKSLYDSTYKAMADAAVAGSTNLPPGTGTTITIPGTNQKLELPSNTPDIILKAVNFCLRRLGDPYKWAGAGPLYDCSSFVTAAYASASGALRAVLDEPDERHHGENTYTLYAKGRFDSVKRDELLPGDLVFFESGPDHVGMYLNEGLFIHDPHTGDVVKISHIGQGWYRDQYLGARRLVPWQGRGRGSGD